MSSTKSTPQDDELREFFANKLVVLAEKLRKENIQLMPLRPDDSEETWYVDYPADCEELFTFDSSKIGAELRELWGSQGSSQLLEICDPIGDLAEKLSVQSDDDNDDVSPFIYVMF